MRNGARMALRVLRIVQREVYNESAGMCLLLPIATGINPATNLSTRTEGMNIAVHATLLTFDEFTAFTVAEHKTLNHAPVCGGGVPSCP